MKIDGSNPMPLPAGSDPANSLRGRPRLERPAGPLPLAPARGPMPVARPDGPLPLARGAAPRSPAATHAHLESMAHELEGVFLNQLFQAMRSSVPESDLGGGNGAKDLFTSMLDQKLASVAAQKMSNDVSEAMVRQLERRTAPPAEPGTTGGGR